MKTPLYKLLKAANFDPDAFGVEADMAVDDPHAIVAALVNEADLGIDTAIAKGVKVDLSDFGITDSERYMIGKSSRDAWRLRSGSHEAPVEIDPGVQVEARIAKSVPTKQVAYCVVYSPVECQGEDVHSDWMTSAEIEKTAWRFLAKGLTNKVDTEHSYSTVDAEIVESFLVRKGDLDFPNDEGAWVVAVRFNDPDVWDRVLKGEYTGLSMAGFGSYVTETSNG